MAEMDMPRYLDLDPLKDIWNVLNFDDWTEDLGQSLWSSFTSFLDELYKADDSILTFD